MNKPVYLGMSVLDISKTLMYKFWYDYIKPNYEDRAKLCYTDTDSFIIHIITEYFFADIFDDVLIDGLIHLTMMKMIKDFFQQVKIQKVIGLFKDELGGKIIKQFCTLRAKTYSYLMGDDREIKKAKETKKCRIK